MDCKNLYHHEECISISRVRGIGKTKQPESIQYAGQIIRNAEKESVLSDTIQHVMLDEVTYCTPLLD